MIPVACSLLRGDEEVAIHHVLTSGQLAHCENVATFENSFAGVCLEREATAISSGTADLHLALLAHDIGHGDEVITMAFTLAATANAILPHRLGPFPSGIQQHHVCRLEKSGFVIFLTSKEQGVARSDSLRN